MALKTEFFMASAKKSRTERKVLKMELETGETVEQEVHILKYTDAEWSAQRNKEMFAMAEKNEKAYAEARSFGITQAILDEDGKPHMTLEQARLLDRHIAEALTEMVREVNAKKKPPLQEAPAIGSGTSSHSDLGEQSES